MYRVGIRAEDVLVYQVKKLFPEDQDRVKGRVIARMTEYLNNGKKQRTRPLEVDLEWVKAVAFERACRYNGKLKLILADWYLPEELERLQ